MKAIAFLHGSKVLLRAPEAGDFKLLFQMRNDVELQLWLMALPRPNSTKRVQAWLDGIAADERRILFIVATRRGSRPLGYVQLNQIDSVHQFAEIGICLSDAGRGRGFSAEAMLLVEQYGHEVLNLRKLMLRVRSDNARALALYRTLAYREVGILKAHFCQGGQQYDVTLMEKFVLPGK